MRIDVERNFNVINVVYKTPTANIILDNRILTKKKERISIHTPFIQHFIGDSNQCCI